MISEKFQVVVVVGVIMGKVWIFGFDKQVFEYKSVVVIVVVNCLDGN